MSKTGQVNGTAETGDLVTYTDLRENPPTMWKVTGPADRFDSYPLADVETGEVVGSSDLRSPSWTFATADAERLATARTLGTSMGIAIRNGDAGLLRAGVFSQTYAGLIARCGEDTAAASRVAAAFFAEYDRTRTAA